MLAERVGLESGERTVSERAGRETRRPRDGTMGPSPLLARARDDADAMRDLNVERASAETRRRETRRDEIQTRPEETRRDGDKKGERRGKNSL